MPFKGKHNSNSSRFIHPNIIRSRLIVSLILYSFISMSLFYQVMGSIRCPKIKKHAGIRLRPLHKAKEPFVPGDVVLFSCETHEYTQTVKCLEDGRWNDLPNCPDPSKNVCPDLGPILHGSYNATSPFKVGTIVTFRCDNQPPNQSAAQTNSYISSNDQTSSILKKDQLISESQQKSFSAPATTTIATNANLNEIDTISASNLTTSTPSETYGTPANLTADPDYSPVRYNLTGHKVLRCLPSSRWNHPMPTCSPILPEAQSNLGLYLTLGMSLLIPILFVSAMIYVYLRWKKRKQRTERWKQYFTDYNKYRSSKTSITFVLKQQQANSSSNPTIPVTDL